MRDRFDDESASADDAVASPPSKSVKAAKRKRETDSTTNSPTAQDFNQALNAAANDAKAAKAIKKQRQPV